MNTLIERHLAEVLHHLYINPLEKCNLRCEICYTRKTSPILPKDTILGFIKKYQQQHVLETITFCGGEVFTLPYFPELVNLLTTQQIFVQVITNGTIDKLAEFTHPNLINLIVSIDGLETYHDHNRGKGNFFKSLTFMKKALRLGFHTEVFSIVTKQNLHHIDELEQYFTSYFGRQIPVTYHPRKPPSYLLHHPVSNIVGTIQNFDFLEPHEMTSLLQTRNTFPPKDLGCYQIAVTSDGKVYGCCEGVTAIGTIDDDITTLTSQLEKRLLMWEHLQMKKGCLGCSQPDFICGMKAYL